MWPVERPGAGPGKGQGFNIINELRTLLHAFSNRWGKIEHRPGRYVIPTCYSPSCWCWCHLLLTVTHRYERLRARYALFPRPKSSAPKPTGAKERNILYIFLFHLDLDLDLLRSTMLLSTATEPTHPSTMAVTTSIHAGDVPKRMEDPRFT